MLRTAWRMPSVALAASALLFLITGFLGSAAPAAAASHEVDVLDSRFGTAVLVVQVGDTVTWRNVDDRPHTVTSEDGTFDSGNLDEGVSFTFTFTEPGTYAYLCEYHPEMRATVVVDAAPTPQATQAAPAEPTPTADQASAAGHGDHEAATPDDQPDTAMPAPQSVPPAAMLLWGLGLLCVAVAVVPSRAASTVLPSRTPRTSSARPPCGWRR